jgi:tetratricopeptide (TPR) repeat protein
MQRSLAFLSLVVALACSCTPRSGAAVRESTKVDCLAAVSGASNAEVSLQAAQRATVTEKPDASAWVRVGQAWLRLARLRSQPDHFVAAEDCAARALAQNANDPSAMRLRGLLHMNAHRFAAARELSQTLLARNPSDTLSWGTLSDAELELGHISEATAAAQHMLDQKPSLLSYGRAAHLRWLIGDRPGAKRLYQAAIAAGQAQADPEPRVWMTVQAAWVFWHEGDYAGAQRGFELALSQLPDYAPALEGLGRTALSRGEYSQAITWLERAQQLHPLAETAWWLGDAYMLSGKRDLATAQYREVERIAARMDPRTLALFYATQAREPREALRLAKLAWSERQDGYTKDVLAFALYRNGELTEATRLARELSATAVPDARLIYRAGLILRAAGAAAEGGELLSRALTLNPRFDPLFTGAGHGESTAQL